MRTSLQDSIIILLVLPLAFLWQSSSCRSTNANPNVNSPMNSNSPNPSRDLRGQWGAQGISMEVTDNGATIEYDCGRGRITEKISPDGEGKFTAKGVHIREHGGPQREEDENGLPADYRGTIKDQTMTLTVELTKDKQRIGTFTLTQGSSGRVRKCL